MVINLRHFIYSKESTSEVFWCARLINVKNIILFCAFHNCICYSTFLSLSGQILINYAESRSNTLYFPCCVALYLCPTLNCILLYAEPSYNSMNRLSCSEWTVEYNCVFALKIYENPVNIKFLVKLKTAPLLKMCFLHWKTRAKTTRSNRSRFNAMLTSISMASVWERSNIQPTIFINKFSRNCVNV